MRYEQLILDEVKKDPVAKWAVEIYENEGYTISIDNFIDIDNFTHIRTIIYPSGSSEPWIVATGQSLEDIKDFFRYQLDILR